MTNDERVAISFRDMSFTRRDLHDALRLMCPAAIKGFTGRETRRMQALWSPQQPTRFCCYFVSEMVYWYVAPPATVAYAVTHEATLHRYLVYAHSGTLIDLTCDQFYTPVKYQLGRRRFFLQTAGHGPSKRARELASHLGLTVINDQVPPKLFSL